MPRRRHRRGNRKHVREQTEKVGAVQQPYQETAVEPREEPYDPKPGPGQLFMQELIDVQSGNSKRYRNVGASPLSIAHHSGKLIGPGDVISGITAADRWHVGDRFADLWRLRESTGTNPFERIGGGDVYWWNDHKADASEMVARIRSKMYGKNFLIVQYFCGEGYSMAASVRKAGVDHSAHGIIPRVREALDDLVTVMTGRRAD